MPSSITNNIKLLIEWAPILSIMSAIGAAKQGQEQALQVAKLAEFLASKTQTKIDDELVRVISAILLTAEGAALVAYLTDLVAKASESHNVPAGPSGN